MSGPGERSRHVLTRNPLTHAVGKVLPAHLGMVHALSIAGGSQPRPRCGVSDVRLRRRRRLRQRPRPGHGGRHLHRTHQPADGHGGRGWPPSADGGSTDRLPGYASTSGPTGLCIWSVVKAGSGLKSLLRRLGREILEVRQRQRWRSEGIGIQRLRVDPAVSALDEASGLMKPEPEVRTSFHPDRRSPDDSRISGLRHARTAVFLESCLGRP